MLYVYVPVVMSCGISWYSQLLVCHVYNSTRMVVLYSHMPPVNLSDQIIVHLFQLEPHQVDQMFHPEGSSSVCTH